MNALQAKKRIERTLEIVVSRSTFYRWLASGLLPAQKLTMPHTRKLIITEAQLNEFLRKVTDAQNTKF